MEEEKLKELVTKYSQFINFPIYLWESKVGGAVGVVMPSYIVLIQ